MERRFICVHMVAIGKHRYGRRISRMAKRTFTVSPVSASSRSVDPAGNEMLMEILTQIDLMGFDIKTKQGIIDGLRSGLGYSEEDQAVLIGPLMKLQGVQDEAVDVKPEWDWDDDDVESATDVNGAAKKDYGGAYDIEPDMFFTKDDLIELTDEVLNHVQEALPGTFRLEDAYIGGQDNQDVHVEVEWTDTGCVYTFTQRIDMRKIRKPSDLRDRYSLTIAGNLISQMRADAQEQGMDVSGSSNIQDDAEYGADMVNVSCAGMEARAWSDMDWPEQINYMKKYVRGYEGTRVFEDFAEHVGLPVEDIIDCFCDAEARGGLKVPQRKQADSDYANDDIYSSTDAEATGAMSKTTDNESTIVGGIYDAMGVHGPNPPEYPDPIELDDIKEEADFNLDAVIIIDDEGSWTYEDESYKWAQATDKEADLYSDEYPHVLLSDLTTTVENVDSLLETLLPMTPGKYRIKGHVNLVYDLTNIFAYRSEHEDEEDDVIEDDIEVKFNFKESYIKNFKINSVQSGDVSSSTSVEASSWFLDSTKKTTTPQGYTNFTVFSQSSNKLNRYRVLDNDVDNFDEGHEYMFAISKLSPYDDAKYVYCQYRNGVVSYAQDGKVIAKEYYIPDDAEYEQFSEWQNDVISRCLDKLEGYNSKISAKIIHN